MDSPQWGARLSLPATRLASALAARRATGSLGFIPYLTAGFPSLTATIDCALALAGCGADAIELGVPFSDPIADGPAIQRASHEAVLAGTSLAQVLEVARTIRAQSAVPLVLMSYVNPILAYGATRFAPAAADAGVDGVLLSDLPPEEEPLLWESLAARHLARIHLVAPTTPPARRRELAALSTGFVYVLSRLGVTGGAAAFSADLPTLLTDVRAAAQAPIAVGFGISRPDHITDALREADAIIVGSALVQVIDAARHAPAAAVREWCAGFCPALGRKDVAA